MCLNDVELKCRDKKMKLGCAMVVRLFGNWLCFLFVREIFFSVTHCKWHLFPKQYLQFDVT